MKFRLTIVSLLLLATAATAPGFAGARDKSTDIQVESRTTQRSASSDAPSTRKFVRTRGYNDRTSHVQDASDAYWRRRLEVRVPYTAQR